MSWSLESTRTEMTASPAAAGEIHHRILEEDQRGRVFDEVRLHEVECGDDVAMAGVGDKGHDRRVLALDELQGMFRQRQAAPLQREDVLQGHVAQQRMALAPTHEDLIVHILATGDAVDARNAVEEDVVPRQAQCYTQLGRLYGNTRKQEAAAALIQAGMIYEQLAAENKQMLRYRVGRLESELRGAVLEGFDSAKDRLLLAEKIEQTLQQNWPTDPVAFYDMASFLTEQEPVLSELGNAAQGGE